MRILQVLPDFSAEYGGPVRSAMSMTRALQRNGHTTLTVSARGNPESWPGECRTFRGITVPFLPRPVAVLSIGMLLWIARNHRSFDKVHFHFGRTVTLLPAGILVRLLHKPYNLQTHGMCKPWKGWKKWVDLCFTVPIVRGAENVFCLTDIEQGELLDWNAKNVVVLDNAVEVSTTTAVRRPPNQPKFVFSARLHPRKGLMTYLQAAQLFSERSLSNASFVVLGADEGERPKGEKFAKNNSLSVEWFGVVSHDEVLKHFQSSTALVHPAEDEPFGMSMIEALSQGLPVITARTSALAPRMLQAGVAILIGEEDVNGYVAAMERLASDEQFWLKQSSASHRWILDNFTVDALARKLTAFYP